MPELASFSESSRENALQRFQLLRAHLEDGRSLAAIALEEDLFVDQNLIILAELLAFDLASAEAAALNLCSMPLHLQEQIEMGSSSAHRRASTGTT